MCELVNCSDSLVPECVCLCQLIPDCVCLCQLIPDCMCVCVCVSVDSSLCVCVSCFDSVLAELNVCSCNDQLLKQADSLCVCVTFKCSDSLIRLCLQLCSSLLFKMLFMRSGKPVSAAPHVNSFPPVGFEALVSRVSCPLKACPRAASLHASLSRLMARAASLARCRQVVSRSSPRRRRCEPLSV